MSLRYTDMNEYTREELRELLEKKKQRLEELENQPTNLYIWGDNMSYMSAMSQMHALDGAKEDIQIIRDEINRRIDEERRAK